MYKLVAIQTNATAKKIKVRQLGEFSTIKIDVYYGNSICSTRLRHLYKWLFPFFIQRVYHGSGKCILVDPLYIDLLIEEGSQCMDRK